MDFRLRGNDRKGFCLLAFLVTPLCGVTFSRALCAKFNMAEQSPALSLSVFLRIGGNHIFQ
jgi:hypothetical protein